MLSHEDNELLVRVGPGTPMGELFRRFWTPIMLDSEIAGPDSPPVRVAVLGEKLVAFRDTSGTIGLLSAHERRVRTRAYPTLERGGLVWAYLGPPEHQPAFPNYEGFAAPPSHRFIRKIVAPGNWLQLMEGDVDSSHVSFLHRSLDKRPLPGSRVDPNTFADTMPRWFPRDTDYGLMLCAQRDAGPDRYQWRINQFLMPYVTLIAAPPGLSILHQVRVPIDDETTLHFRCFIHPERPLGAEELATFEAGVIVPKMIPRTFTMAENSGNDYLIDREAQRTQTYTGIRSIVAQDMAVVGDQGGPIADRSQEYLVSSDRAIIALRKRLLGAAKALVCGLEPLEARNDRAYAVRPGDFMLPRDVPVEAGARAHRLLAEVSA